MTRFLAIAIETIAACAVMTGIALEVYYEADFGFVLITAGSLGVAVGSMIYAKIWRWRK